MGAGSFSLETFTTFGELLKYLRKRVQLSQRQLSIAVGYSESQISRLEANLRAPDKATLMALFVPALAIQDEPETLRRLMELAQQSNSKTPGKPAGVQEKHYSHNLPVQLTSFIGREQEIETVGKLLESYNLVTLTGSGGVGKTRLALQVVKELLEQYPDGIWFVDLTSVTDPSRVFQTIALTLGLKAIGSQSIRETLLEYLQEKQALVLLDNCEHLIEACAAAVRDLLQSCLKLKILATSREAMWVAGETPFWVPSLSLPDPHNKPAFEQIVGSDAVRLFVERAVQISPAFILNEANASWVLLICQRLDGIPLAIELAAARMRILSVKQIATRLDDIFRLLTTNSRDSIPRHQTLRAVIDWSFDLLTPAERLALLRLSIFAGSWTLEAAESVCSYPVQQNNNPYSDIRIQRCEVLDLMTELEDKSLIIPFSAEDGINRYRMLETIRRYTHEKLVDLGEADAARDQHLAYYVELAKQAEPNIHGRDQIKWLNLLEDELDNLRLALEWSLPRRVDAGLRLISNLCWFWHLHSHVMESTEFLEKLLAAEEAERGNRSPDREHNLVLAKAIATLGSLAQWGFYSMPTEALLALLKENVNRMRDMENPPPRELGLALFDYIIHAKLPVEQLGPSLEECLALFQQAKDKYHVIEILQRFASIDQDAGNWTGYREKTERCVAIAREAGIHESVAYNLKNLAYYWMNQGDYEKAEKMLRESIVIFQQVKNFWQLSLAYIDLESVISARGDASSAARQKETTASFYKDIADKRQIVVLILVAARDSWLSGNEAWAESLCQKIGAILEMDPQAIDNAVTRAGYQFLLGRLAYRQGDWASAKAHFNDALTLFSGKRLGEIDAVLATLGILACAQGYAEKAARLFGAVSDRYSAFEGLLSSRERRDYEQGLTTARQSLGEAAFQAAWANGQAMTREQAVAYALEEHG
jgi:predicted ATPase/transcriptional regulator with XRE-family HTH domain